MTLSANEVLVPKVRPHQENKEKINKLLKETRAAYIGWQNDISATSKKDRFKQIQRIARRDYAPDRTPQGR